MRIEVVGPVGNGDQISSTSLSNDRGSELWPVEQPRDGCGTDRLRIKEPER